MRNPKLYDLIRKTCQENPSGSLRGALLESYAQDDRLAASHIYFLLSEDLIDVIAERKRFSSSPVWHIEDTPHHFCVELSRRDAAFLERELSACGLISMQQYEAFLISGSMSEDKQEKIF